MAQATWAAWRTGPPEGKRSWSFRVFLKVRKRTCCPKCACRLPLEACRYSMLVPASVGLVSCLLAWYAALYTVEPPP
jgi:hypothetical protein